MKQIEVRFKDTAGKVTTRTVQAKTLSTALRLVQKPQGYIFTGYARS